MKGNPVGTVDECVKTTVIKTPEGEKIGERRHMMTAYPLKSWRRNYQNAKGLLKQERKIKG